MNKNQKTKQKKPTLSRVRLKQTTNNKQKTKNQNKITRRKPKQKNKETLY